MTAPIDARAIEDFLRRIVPGNPANDLRNEDKKKVRELCGLLPEIERALAKARAPTIVDAASGRGWVGLAAMSLLAPRLAGALSVVAIERDTRRLELARDAAKNERLEGYVAHAADVSDASVWPERADLVVALHACGDASDRTIERAIAIRAKHVLVAPCCLAMSLPAARRGREEVARLGLPRRGEIRRRFVEAFVMGTRTLALEAGGYHTDAVAFVPETVTPYNLVLRGRLVDEPERRESSRLALERLLGGATTGEPRSSA
jgi:hypothetical protein